MNDGNTSGDSEQIVTIQPSPSPSIITSSPVDDFVTTQRGRYSHKNTGRTKEDEPPPSYTVNDHSSLNLSRFLTEESSSEEDQDGMASIEAFSGTSTEDAETFIKLFANWCTFKKLNEDASCAALPLHLKKGALGWYDNLKDNIKKDFGQVVRAFIERYDSKNNQWKVAASLWSIKQKPGQPVEDFITEIERAGNKAGEKETQICYAILSGLLPTIRAHVLQKEPTSIQEIQKWASLAETSMEPALQQAQLTSDVVTAVKDIQSQLQKLQLQPITYASATNDDGLMAVEGQLPQQHQQQQQRMQPIQDQPRWNNWRNPSSSTSGNWNRSGTPSRQNNNWTGNRDSQPQMRSNTQNWNQRKVQQTRSSDTRNCTYCGGKSHLYNNCPANNARCHKCKKFGHFQAVCRFARRYREQY